MKRTRASQAETQEEQPNKYPRKPYTLYSKNRYSYSIPRMPGIGLPPKQIVKHKYVEGGTLSCTSGVVAKQVFLMNSMYDPNQTGSGHQPILFDNMSLLYNHFTVLRAYMRVTFTPGQGQTVPMYVGIFPDDDGTVSITDPNTLLEQPGAKNVCMLAKGDTAASKILTFRYNARQQFGGGVLANNALQGTASSNPSETSAAVLYAVPIDGTSTVACFWNVEIWYTACWVELKGIAGS